MLILKAPEVAKRLNLTESVFKKYIILLERQGYTVERNRQGHRLFNAEDLENFEKFLELSRYDGLTLENAAKMVVDSLPENKKESGHHNVITNDEDGHNVMTLVTKLLAEQERQLTHKFELQAQQMRDQLTQMEKNQNELLLEIRDKLDKQNETIAEEKKVEEEKQEEMSNPVEEVKVEEKPKKRFFEFWK